MPINKFEDLIKTFNATATVYDKAGALPQNISERLINRVEDLKITTPKRILDIGCGTGFCIHLLKQRYPKTAIVGLDWAFDVLQQAKINQPPIPGLIEYVQGDLQQLPFDFRSFDLICANLSLLWVEDLYEVLNQIKKRLNLGGVLLFTYLGPDTFEPITREDSLYRNGLMDMHTIGDMLVSGRWQDITMDVDHWITQHDNGEAFYQELTQLGLHTLLSNSSITSTKGFSSIHEVPWEIIYGQAFRGEEGSYMNEAGEISVPLTDLIKRDR